MKTNHKCFILSMLTISIFLFAGIAAGDEPVTRFEIVANRMVKAINAEDFAGIQQDFSKTMSEALPLDKTTMFFKGLISQCGKIKKTGQPRLIPPDQAVFACHFERTILDMKIVLDQSGKIIGLWFLPHSPPLPVRESHLTVLRLPFEGEWMVVWGGDTLEVNQHHNVQNQRYAFDFLVSDSSGRTSKGDGKQNEDYFAFGKPVSSPADGIVTDVITGVRDNTPGSMNPYSALGNAVCIEHCPMEISVLAHFKQGSILVKPGDKVKRGQVLGLCGNSGNSSEPHIHYHLQNTPVIQDGTGIRCLFDKVNVTRDGKTESKASYSPVKGDFVKEQ